MEQGVVGIDILTTAMVGIRWTSRYTFRARILQKTTGRGQGVDEDYSMSVNGVFSGGLRRRRRRGFTVAVSASSERKKMTVFSPCGSRPKRYAG
jgi:hypothetical protein